MESRGGDGHGGGGEDVVGGIVVKCSCSSTVVRWQNIRPESEDGEGG